MELISTVLNLIRSSHSAKSSKESLKKKLATKPCICVMCVRVYVCMCVCMCVCVLCVLVVVCGCCTYVHMCAHMFVYTFVSMFV